MLHTENLTKSFRSSGDTVTALRNVSIHAEPGEFVILNGKSGSGKTTLLNILSALDYPDSGTVTLDGCDITKLTQAQRDELRRSRIGLVFQSIVLIGDMTARENIDFAMRIAEIGAKERKKRAEECLEMVGLSGRSNHLPQELSGGEQQRVAIARAMAHRPSVIFADEPTAQLDMQMSLRIIRLFAGLVKTQGITFIMTTHNPEILEIADLVYTLKDGEIVHERS